MKYSSLDAVGDAFISATDKETGAFWEQGQVVIEAVQSGFDVDTVTRHCAGLVRRTGRTIYRRYATVRTFPEPHPELTYEFHALCADLVDYRLSNPDEIERQQKQAHDWLQLAAESNYSTRTLKAAIQAAGGKVEDKPEILLDGSFAIFEGVGAAPKHGGMRSLYLRISVDDYRRLLNVDNETEVQITLLKALSVEKVKP